ncbi:MAG: serine/threonine-protein kinase [Acidobacteriota bacterium]
MQAGQRIHKYVLEQKLGEGGMAEVWRARHTELDKLVAIKRLSPRLSADPEFEQRFLMEGRRQARLRHPNIVPVIDCISEGSDKYLVMEYVEGESLEAALKRAGGPLPPQRAIYIAWEVAGALAHAHRQNLIHRDVKPANILLDREGRSYLADFGIALMLGDQRVTRGGVAVGTVHYMSPEQITRPRELDHRTDIYSFGCVLYEMITGRPPFIAEDGDTDFTVMAGHLEKAPCPPRNLNPATPEAVESVTLRCLAKSPDERFSSAEELAEALRQAWHATATQPAARATASAAPPAARSSARRWVYTIVLVLAGGIAAAGAFLWLSREAPPAAQTAPEATAVTPAPVAVTPVPAAEPARVVEPPKPQPLPPRPRPVTTTQPSAEELRLRACRAMGLTAEECAKKNQEEAARRRRACLALGLSEEECAQRFGK